MNRKLTLLLALLYTCATTAQVRTGADFGPAFTLKGKKNDTAFFGRNYFNTQLRMGWHKGRMGLVVSGGMMNQNAGDVQPKERLRLDTLNAPAAEYAFSGGDVKSTFFTAGPEICFPFGPVRLTIHLAAGISFIKAEPTAITRPGLTSPVYQSDMDKKTTGITKAGAGLNYYFNNRIAFTLHSEHIAYKLKYKNVDKRNSQGTQTKTITERKSLLAVTGGITFKL